MLGRVEMHCRESDPTSGEYGGRPTRLIRLREHRPWTGCHHELLPEHLFACNGPHTDGVRGRLIEAYGGGATHHRHLRCARRHVVLPSKHVRPLAQPAGNARVHDLVMPDDAMLN